MRTHLEGRDLLRHAHEINEREANISEMRNKTMEMARATVAEALLQGQSLIAARSDPLMKPADWLPWLRSHCPRTEPYASRYMATAKKADRLPEINQLRLAIDLGKETKPKAEPHSWPAYLELLSKLNKAKLFAEEHPAQKNWPASAIDDLRKYANELMDVIGKLIDQHEKLMGISKEADS